MHTIIHFSISYKNCTKSVFNSFQNSISKFCNHKHQPGEYIFHAENDDAHFTKMFMLHVRSKLNYQEIQFQPSNSLTIINYDLKELSNDLQALM